MSAPANPYPQAEDVQAVAAWRREPYRVFFPLGVALAWAGVSHWLLHALGVLADYRPVFHSMVQIQGFMTCFAVGFLFTAIPRRTGTPPPATWQMLAGLMLPVGTTVAGWYGQLAVAQACWIAMVLVLVSFAVRRFLTGHAARRPPASFIWIPVSLGLGLIGALMTAALSISPEYFWLHELGKGLVLQGVFLGLVVGVGGMVLPLITCGDAPPDAELERRAGARRAAHLIAAAALALSFWIEVSHSARSGLALRGAVTLLVLLAAGRIWRLPRVAGWHRRLVWLSAWAIPLGYLLAAAYPAQKKAGLHVVFIGGFALMALSVGIHVTLAHGGHRREMSGRPWQVPLLGILMVAAGAGRALVDFDQARFFWWLGASSAAFLAATVLWGLLIVPRLADNRVDGPGDG